MEKINLSLSQIWTVQEQEKVNKLTINASLILKVRDFMVF